METEERTRSERAFGQVGFFKSLRGSLLVWFLLLALVPVGMTGALSIIRARQALTDSATDKLVAVGETSRTTLVTFFQRWQAELLFVSRLDQTRSNLMDLAGGFRFLGPDRVRELYLGQPGLPRAEDGSAYSIVHLDEHEFFSKFNNIRGFEDILLIDTKGNVVYTNQKGDDFGVSLRDEPFRNTNLGALYETLRGSKTGEVHTVDAGRYGDSVAMFMGTPVAMGESRSGYLVFRLPMAQISGQIQTRTGMGDTGEIYLVGPDFRMRSDSLNDPTNRTVAASFAGTVAANGVDTKAVRQALAGKPGTGIISDYRGVEVLSSWAPVDLKDFTWAILSEMDVAEALQPAYALEKTTLSILAVVVLLTVAFSLYASGRIVLPIRNLTGWARNVAAGDLSLVDVETPQNEIGILNHGIRAAVLSLQGAKAEEDRQNWFKTGRIELEDAMRSESELDGLCRVTVTHVAKYLGAQVGAFFVRDKDGSYGLKASYAYKTRKHLTNAFKAGEGLVGQAALEKESILLTEVPDDYVSVSSGLGEKPPKHILVVPLVLNDQTLGVLEIGSFDPFTEDRRAFLEEASERIAMAVNLALSRHELKQTLRKTQEQAEELQSQEEELRAANEELEEKTERLQASEESLKAQEEELRASNEELEEKAQALEERQEMVAQKNQELMQTKAELEEKARDLEVAGKYKSEFLANMSHELRTPLNSLILLAQDLSKNKEKNLTEKQVEAAEIIRKGGEELLQLIQDVLDISKIEAGRMTVTPESTALERVVEDVLAGFRLVCEEKGLTLDGTIEAGLPGTIHTDGQKLEQLLRNLLSNAVKFTSEGGVTLRVFRPDTATDLTRSGLAPEQTIAFSVTDTGIGISKDKKALIFEAFFQADGSTSRQYGGTGLGLSISRELARLLGGEVGLESEVGKGTTFTVYLPEAVEGADTQTRSSTTKPMAHEESDRPDVPERTAHLKAPTSIPDDRETLQSGDRVVCVIEDDENFARVLYRTCREHHFKCIHAADGKTGLSMVRKFKPDAVALDIRLPGMDGWEVLDALKADPNTRHIPVHVMTVEAETLDAFKKGAMGFLSKPVNREGLEKAFSRIEDFLQKDVKQLLIVEDDPVMQKEILNLIGNGDVVAKAVDTGEAAIQEIMSQSYDCVILDLKLPDMSGFEVLKRLDETDTVAIPPIVIYTGREISQEEEFELARYTSSIILKGARSQERLLDETALFLHRVVDRLPPEKQEMIARIYEGDTAFSGKHVLVVDDDMRNVYAVSSILEERGMVVHKAANGKKALDALDENPEMDLILMDIMMPEMDGYEAMHHIREQDRFKGLPILAVTAKAMKEDRDKCIQAGADDYLSKPVDIDRLLSLMRVWLIR